MRLVASGGAALPEFQRDFVWDPNQVVELLDSVANGWPIGSLLILEGPQPFGIKPIEGGPPVDPNRVRYYLLDGQQRVTSLYHVLTDSGDYVYYLDLADDANEDEAPPIRWTHRSRGIPRSRRETSLTIAELADERYFKNRLRELSSNLLLRARSLHKDRVGYLSGGAYHVPATLMLRDIELEALTRIFETLNRTGVRLDAFDLMVAVLYPGGFHLREAWKIAIDRYPRLAHFDTHGLELLKVIALWRREHDQKIRGVRSSKRVTGVRQRDILRIPPDYVQNNWQRAIDAYDAALRFLQDEAGVADASGIPSEAMVLTISYFLESGRGIQYTRTWYWTAIADQRYLQGANTQILSDITEPHTDSASVASSLSSARASLQEPARRNRILRMGVRGLIVRQGGLDPLTKTPLAGGSVIDVSVSSLVTGAFEMRLDLPTAEILVFSEESANKLKRNFSTSDLDKLLGGQVFESQGAPPFEQLNDFEWWRSERAREIADRMERAL